MKANITVYFFIMGIFSLNSCKDSGFDNNVVVNKKVNLKVWGNCEMCKETIETSLKVKGVKEADWNKDTKIITIAFDSTKISLDQIEKNVATVGYDNEKYRGDDGAYNNLPECCQYERKMPD